MNVKQALREKMGYTEVEARTMILYGYVFIDDEQVRDIEQECVGEWLRLVKNGQGIRRARI